MALALWNKVVNLRASNGSCAIESDGTRITRNIKQREVRFSATYRWISLIEERRC
jgi:hypothetical protein